MSLRRLGRKYGMAHNSVRWILSNPIYVGMLRWKGELVQGKPQPIIDQKTWEDVQGTCVKRKANP